MSDELAKLAKEILDAFTCKGHVSIKKAALKLDCSPRYLRKHLILFPNVWRMDGGDIRIPVKDIEAMIAKRKIHKFKTPPTVDEAKIKFLQ